jgi:hypothetical protein
VSLPVRVVTLLVAFAAVVVGAVFIVIHYLLGGPPMVDYTSVASGGQVNVVLQEDPQNGVTATPDWVSYFVQNPQTKQWEHTTLFKVPAATQVNVTIFGYDGCTPLRNNFWSKVQGTIGDTVNVAQVSSKGVTSPSHTASVINSWSNCNVGHTFAIPGLNLSVPVASPPGSETNNLCSNSPCTSGPHSVETFSFRTPRSPGIFRWQCFVPCGGGFIDGNGGPMQTIGFMMGNMEVAA